MSDIIMPIIIGPTASGKTRLAVALADYFGGEIISADSRQVFRLMNIGTGKDINEYYLFGKKIPYHLIDIKDAGDTYNVNAFKEDFNIAYQYISLRKKMPILCGGTGMYVHSILQNHSFTSIPVNQRLRDILIVNTKDGLIDYLERFPIELRTHVDYSSTKRLIRAIEIAEYLSENEMPIGETPEIKTVTIGLHSDVELRRKRINERLHFRLKNGLIEEVEGLLKAGINPEILIFYGMEYKFVTLYLKNEFDYPTLVEYLEIAIRQFAKRQMTFFRKMEKDGVEINWLNTELDFVSLKDKAIRHILDRMESK